MQVFSGAPKLPNLKNNLTFLLNPPQPWSLMKGSLPASTVKPPQGSSDRIISVPLLNLVKKEACWHKGDIQWWKWIYSPIVPFPEKLQVRGRTQSTHLLALVQQCFFFCPRIHFQSISTFPVELAFRCILTLSSLSLTEHFYAGHGLLQRLPITDSY